MNKSALEVAQRLNGSYKDMGRVINVWLTTRRRQGVCDTTPFTVCEEPELLGTTEVTPRLADVCPDHESASSAKRPHLERGGLDRWNFGRKKR